MDIGAVLSWLKTNWVVVAQVYAAIVTLASIIVKLTPTLRDDTILLAIIKFIAKYLALNTKAPEERPK